MNKIILFILCAFSISLNATSNRSSSISSTGIIADLRYMDVSVTAGSNQIDARNGYLFTAADVGKLIAIKKGHHNPSSTAEIPFTTPGRIVTVTAQVTSVSTDGTSASINGVAPNQGIDTRAYVYTNNYDALQALITAGGEITLSQNGIIGVNPFYHNDYTETTNKALVFPDNVTTTIRNTSNARIKLCSETINWDYKFALFASQVSNHDIKLDVSCIPPDEASTRWGGQCSFFTTTLFSVNGAEDSVRTIELKNTTPLTSDIDTGTDPFWNSYFNGVKGGIEGTTSYQEIFILNDDPNAEVRTRNGGISQFGGDSQITITNLKVNYSGHYIGENGRSFTSEGIYTETDGGRWLFDNFKIENGVLKPTNPNADFSWYDYVAPSRAMGVRINGGLFYQFHIDSPMEPNLADIINGHNLDISNTGLPNTTNATIVIQFHDDNRPTPSETVPNPPSRLIISSNTVRTFGHPNYVHPDVAFRITNITSEFGHWRYYATGNQYLIDPNDVSLGEVDTIIKPAFSEIYDSNIQGTGLQFQNFGEGTNNQEVANATRGTLKVVNSDIKARLIFGELELTDTEIDGEHVYVNSLTSNGGNRLEFQVVDVYDSDFISLNDHYDGNLVRFLKEDVLVKFDNTTFGTNYGGEHLFPYVPNGTLHYLNNTDNTNRLPRFDNSINETYSNEFTEESTVIFENCEFAHVDGNSLFSKGFNNGVIRDGAKVEFRNFKFRNAIGLGKLIRPYFAPETKNNGMADIPVGDELAVYIFNKTHDLPYSFDGSDINAIGARISFSNQHTLANKSASIIVPTFTINGSGHHFFTTDWANGAYVDGEFTLRITDDFVRFNPYYTNGNTNNKRSNTTLSNLVLNTSGKRQNGEVIRFKVDPKQNRVIEIGSTLGGNPIDKYYVDSDPTGTPGLDGEIVYLEGDDTTFWTHAVSHTDISNTSHTVTPELVDGHTEIETNIHFSIKQELRSETPWEDFEFTLTDDNGDTHTFTNSSTGFFRTNLGLSTEVHPEYIKHFWTFESQNETGSILCYIENRTGKIIFEQELPFGLAPLQALTITKGWKVASQEWIPSTMPSDCQVDILFDFETAEQDYSDGNDCTMFPFGHFNPAWNTAFPWKATKYHAAHYIVTDEAVYNAQGCNYENLWMFPNGTYNNNPADASNTGGENFVMLWAQKQIGAPEYNGITTTIDGLTPGEYYEISFEHSPISTSASGGTRQTELLQYMPLVNFGGTEVSDTPVNYQIYSTTYTNQWYTTTIVMQATAASETLSIEFPILPDPANIVNDGYVGIDNIRVTCSDTSTGNRTVLSSSEITTKESSNKQIAIYPNPTTDILHIELLDSSNQIKSIELFNIQGQLVWKNETIKDQYINISDLKKGIYFINIQTNNQDLIIKKIIKQ
ncbi:T9SS type A sorting domain-containing protein [Dokdonia sp.]|uniref:T9SS type A sorting domain-containing protein n=1 Tax=Dokdonia sp. TaxID=2024995 RepID=UPI003262F67C